MSDKSGFLDYAGLKAELATVGAADLFADTGAPAESEQAALLSGALSLSSHILARDEKQLAGQLLGRMAEADGPDIATLLADARTYADRPALLPLRPTLTRPGAALVRTFTGHEIRVSSVALTPDGRRALSGSDKTLRLWDLASGVQLRLFEVDTSWLTEVAATPDGRHALSGLYDGTLILWDLESGAERRRFEGHQSWVTALAVAPDGRCALSASDDATVRLWDLESGAELLRLEHDFHVLSVAMTPDGRRALSASSDYLFLWDLENGTELARFGEKNVGISAGALTPDGRRALSAPVDAALRLWDLESGSELRCFGSKESRITVIAVTPDGRHAVSGGDDRTLRLWDLESGAELRRLEAHTHDISAVALSADGLRALSGSSDTTLCLWDLVFEPDARISHGRLSDRLHRKAEPFRFEGPVDAVAVTPDGRAGLSCARDDGPLRIWDLESGAEFLSFKRHEGHATAVAVSPDGRRVLLGSDGGSLQLWDLESGASLIRFEEDPQYAAVTAVALTADGRRALSAHRFPAYNDYSFALCYRDLESGKILWTEELEHGWSGIARALAVTPNGRWALLAADDSPRLHLWDLARGEEVRHLEGHDRSVSSVAVTPDGRRALTGSHDQTLRLWDLESGAERRRFEGHERFVKAVALTSDGRRALSGSNDGTLRLWDLESGAELAAFHADAAILCCAVAQVRNRIVAGDDLGRIHVLDILD